MFPFFRYTQVLFLNLLPYSLVYIFTWELNPRLTEQQLLLAPPLPVWVGGQQMTFSFCFFCPTHYFTTHPIQWPVVFEIHSDNLPKSFRSRWFEHADLYSSSNFSNGTLKILSMSRQVCKTASPSLTWTLHSSHLENSEPTLYWHMTPTATVQYRIYEHMHAHTRFLSYLKKVN